MWTRIQLSVNFYFIKKFFEGGKMTDLEKHVNQPGRDKLVKQVRTKINELGVEYYIFSIYFCNWKSCR